MLEAYQAIKFADPDLTRLQKRVQVPLSRVLKVPFLDGVLLTGIALGPSAATQVKHGLSRAIVGWFVVDIDAAARVYRAAQGSLPSSILPLQSDAAATVSVWVF